MTSISPEASAQRSAQYKNDTNLFINQRPTFKAWIKSICLINASAFQVFIKWLIGGLRPHFLSVCKPDLSKVGEGIGFQNIMYTRAVCTGKESEIKEALESMPSGHSTAAFAGFVFLFLYLNAKLKLWSNYHPAYWKMLLVYAPLLCACLISASLTIDAFHHWYDCLAGACIGIINAFGAYRMTYMAIWDWRYNHIPLSRDGFNDQKAPPGYGNFGGFEKAVATRKAGWGLDNNNVDLRVPERLFTEHRV
uniref:Phosphatidic acid phosphatase type 2/haloperoxidase domain-containing protein n=1 Tax=Panagrolaimus sp. PS1159 TaxID=55785 RepID=A0AC35G634_9BILA